MPHPLRLGVAAPAGFGPPAPAATGRVGPTGNEPGCDGLTALRYALALTEAESERELVTRTLDAARAIAAAEVAAVVEPDGGRWVSAGDRYRDPLDTMDGERCARLAARPGEPTGTLADLGLPVALTAGFGAGVLLVADPAPTWPDSGTSAYLTLLASHATASQARLRELDRLRDHANSDPLTGLRHRRPFSDRLAVTVPGRTAVIAIDVDGFKQINDRYGHEAGDRALLTLVRALESALPAGADLYRIGGDEFAVILDVTDPSDGLSTAERLVHAARATGYTVSAGVAIHGARETGRHALNRADAALYRAKRAGRDAAALAA